jgi:hypothetical protein
VQVWLHRWTGSESGWSAWSLDLLGFATWAPSESQVLARVPLKLDEYLAWLDSHGLTRPKVSPGVEVVERISGDEVMFSADGLAVSPDLIDLTIRLLDASRCDLLNTLEQLPDAALDWSPPYRSFAPWATWRSVRQILAHIANTETHYYLGSIGCSPRVAAARDDGDWLAFLAEHRVEAVDLLRGIRDSGDRCRLTRREDGDWSVAKVLRRLVWHELLHLKSIRRIGHEFRSVGERPV